MKKEFKFKKIFTAAALIILSAATVSCGKYTPAGTNPNDPNENTGKTPAIITVKDGEYSLVKSQGYDSYKAVNYFSVLNNFNADGKTDDSKNLQNLLDKAAKSGGTVYLPKGKYRLENTVNIPENVTLTGDFTSPRSASGSDDCTVFIVAENENTLKKPLFTLNGGSKLTEITIFYEGQHYDNVKTYPYAIEHHSGKTAEISYVTIINAAKGIKLSSTEAKEVSLANIYMTATQSGIYALFCSEKLEITDIFIDPSILFNCDLCTEDHTAEAKILTSKIKEGLTAISITATADAYFDDIKINTCNIGVKVDIPSITEKTPLFSDVTVTEAASSALNLVSAPKTGMAFAKCSFRTDDRNNSKDVKIEKNYLAPTVFNSCSFRGSPSYSVFSEGNSLLSFVGCDFISWKESAIYSTDKMISASGGGFNSSGNLADLTDTTVGIFAIDSIYANHDQEKNPTVFVAKTKNEYTVDRITDTWFEDLTSSFTISGKIYKAEDFGISNTAPDNSMALQMAINTANQNGGGTVFIKEGNYKFLNEVEVLEGVRIQGSGNSETVLEFSKTESKAFLNLKGNNKIEGLTLKYTGSQTAEEAAENPIKAIYSESANLKISNVNFTKVHYAIYLSGAENITVENLVGSAVIGGIYAEHCDFMHLEDVEFTKNGLSEDVIKYQHEKFVAVMIRECTGTLCENLTSDNGDYLIYLNSEKVDVVPEEPSAAIKGLFAENVYSAFAINKYDFAAVVNVSSDTAIYGTNAYNVTTFAGNRGNLCIYNVIGKGDVTGGIYLRGGNVSIQSCIFNTCGSTAIRSDSSTAEIIGCIFLDKGVSYHAEVSSGSLSFVANIIDSNSSFAGIERSYLKKYSSSEAAFTEEYNFVPISELTPGT